MYSDNLQLFDEHGLHSEIADFIVCEPIEEDGCEYQQLTLTVPFGRDINVGTKLSVFDAAKQSTVVTFVADCVEMFFRGEQFMKIGGRHYLRIATD